MAKRKRKKQYNNYSQADTPDNDLDLEKSIDFDTAEPVLKLEEPKKNQQYKKPKREYTPENIFIDGKLTPQNIELVRLENGKQIKTICKIRQGVYEEIVKYLDKSVNLSFLMFLNNKTITYSINTKNIIGIKKI